MAAEVYLGLITRADIYWETMVGIMACGGDGVVSRFSVRPIGPYLDDGRNLLVEQYLAETADDPDPPEWFMFVDSDVCSPNPDDLSLAPYISELIAPGGVPLDGERFPVIGGVYINPTKDLEVRPVTYAWRDVERGDGEIVDGFDQHTAEELADLDPYTPPEAPGPLHPEVTDVGAVGTGFMAIHRSLILTMLDVIGFPQPWFWEPVLNGIHMGEDMGFCARVGNMGYPVLVHRGVRLAHYKALKLLPDA